MQSGRLIPLVLLIVLAACGRGRPAQPAGPPPVAPFPAPVRIYYDNSGGIADSVRMVIRDAAEFERVWRQATSRQGSPPPAPTIDFAQDMVLVVGAGRLTPDDRIAVDSVGLAREMNAAGQMEESLRVIVQTTIACQQFELDAYPLELVRVRRYSGDVRFVDRRAQAENCRDAPEQDP